MLIDFWEGDIFNNGNISETPVSSVEQNIMGKVRTDSVKRISNKILRNFPNRFTKDFDENKKILAQDVKIEVKSKRLRNRIVGYMTHLVKIREDDSIVVTE